MEARRNGRRRAFATTVLMMTAAIAIGSSAYATAAPPKAVSKAVLKKSDLPAGWNGKKADTSDSGSAVTGKALLTCLGLPASLAKHHSPEAKALDYTLKGIGASEQTIQNSITVATNAARDTKTVVALQGPNAAGCVNQAFTTEIQKLTGSSGITITDVTTAPVDVGSFLDRTVAFHFAATVGASAGGQTVSLPLVADFVFAQRGKYIANFDFLAVNGPFDESVRTQALRAVTERIKRLPTS